MSGWSATAGHSLKKFALGKQHVFKAAMQANRKSVIRIALKSSVEISYQAGRAVELSQLSWRYVRGRLLGKRQSQVRHLVSLPDALLVLCVVPIFECDELVEREVLFRHDSVIVVVRP